MAVPPSSAVDAARPTRRSLLRGVTALGAVAAAGACSGTAGGPSSSFTAGSSTSTPGTTATAPAPTTASRRPSANPYLAGNFAPLLAEVTGLQLPVEGSIPPALRGGTLLRVGPNPVIVPDPQRYHWFLGDGMVHSLQLGTGDGAGDAVRVDHRSRWVRTDSAAHALDEPELADQPADVTPAGNTANTNIVVHGDRILALLEVGLPTEITDRGATTGRFDFDGRLRSTMTAHPKIDPVTGELVFFGYEIFQAPYLRYHVADASGRLTYSQVIDLPAPTMMHDFAITETAVVFLDLPVVWDGALARTRPFPAAWRPENGARVGVMARSGGPVRWIEIDPCYVFHTANAYDDADGRIILDLLPSPKMFDQDIFGVDDSNPVFERWTIDPARGTVDRRRLTDGSMEFPRTDPRLVGRPYRYSYSAELVGGQGRAFGTLLKVDGRDGSRTRARLPEGAMAGEGIFVPDSPTAGEDEGWVIATCYRPETDTSDLVILDATRFEDGPVATVHLPLRVPFGFHGAWVDPSRTQRTQN